LAGSSQTGRIFGRELRTLDESIRGRLE
jgi:hypothetical protein